MAHLLTTASHPYQAAVNLDIARFEITGVYTHPDAKADIVLVHGLNGLAPSCRCRAPWPLTTQHILTARTR
jgi:hypothetical protein